jgi:hypothetical protein
LSASRAAIQVANASLSQISSHHGVVTKSPNHWCAVSCKRTSAMLVRACGVETPSL